MGIKGDYVVKKKSKKIKYPTRDEIIKALSDDKNTRDLEQVLVILEFDRKTDRIGLIKGELLQNNSIIVRGKLTVFPEMMQDQSIWNNLKVGESAVYGFALEYQEEKLFDMIIEGFKSSIRDGRIPFLNR